MIETLFLYLGTDWLGMICIIIYTYLIASKNKTAFIYGIIGNIAFTIFGILANSFPTILLNLIILVLNIKAYKDWTK